MGLKILRCTRCVHIFVVFGHRRSSRRKKIKFSSYELLRAPTMSKHNKNVHTSCAPKYLQFPKISYFFDFFLFFRIYCSHAYKIYDFLCHELPGCPNGTQICMRLADMTIFDPTKFQIFLIFFCYIFWVVKVL